MDDFSLIRHLVALMGWTVYTDYGRWQQHVIEVGGPGSCLILDGKVRIYDEEDKHLPAYEREWRPLQDMSDAMMIVEKMQKDGYDYEIGSCLYEEGEGHSAMFMRGVHDLYDDTWEEMHESAASSPARAICLAALATGEGTHE